MMEVLLATRVGMSEGARGWTFRARTGAKQSSREEAPPPADDAAVDRVRDGHHRR